MKKKVVCVAVLCIVESILLCGCYGQEKEQCKEKVDAFLSAYQSQESSCGQYLVSNDDENQIEFDGYQAILADSLTYEIGSVDLGKDYDVVNIVIDNIDFGKVCESIVNNNADDFETSDEVTKVLLDVLQSDGVPMRKYEVAVKLVEDHKIQMNNELSNALLGGYPQYIYELTTGDTQ